MWRVRPGLLSRMRLQAKLSPVRTQSRLEGLNSNTLLPKGSKYPIFEVFVIRSLEYWVPGPSGLGTRKLPDHNN